MTQVTIRAPRQDDIARLAEINLIGWRHTYAHLLSEEYFASMPAQLEAKWQSIVIANPPRVKVAEIDGEVVGHAGALDRPAPEAVRPVELLFIYQLPEMHGSGTGQALLDAVIGDEVADLRRVQTELPSSART